MNNDFLNELLAVHPELEEEYNSKQYEMSLEIIKLMMTLGLNSKAVAKKIGCSHNMYLRMESGDTSVPVEEYEKAIYMLKIAAEDSMCSVQHYFRATANVSIVTRKKNDSQFVIEFNQKKMHQCNLPTEIKQPNSVLNQVFEHLIKETFKKGMNVPSKKGIIEETNSILEISYQY